MEQPAKYSHASMFAKNKLNLFGDMVVDEGGYLNVVRTGGFGTSALFLMKPTLYRNSMCRQLDKEKAYWLPLENLNYYKK